MTVSTFELFRIGVGPSSSHTVGPMRAGLEFARSLRERLTTTSADGVPSTVDSGLADDEYVELVGGAVTQDPESITVILYGSLAATGAGHGTLGACLLGLDGADPATVDPDFMGPRLEEIRRTRTINLAGDESLQVQCGFEDIVLRPTVVRTIHTNAVTFSAIVRGQRYKQTFYSIGGGFIRTKEEVPDQDALTGPWLFTSSKELVAKAEELGGSVAEVQRKCEQSRRSDPQINADLDAIAEAMSDCAKRGVSQEGILPGGLGVRRRAQKWYSDLILDDPHQTAEFSTDWVNLVALAVNEENAAGGRVVTAPTNGAAGIIPAVGFYALTFTPAGRTDPKNTARRFLLAAAAVGSLYKERASISGAEVGCQGEVGSAASMAAAGLAEVLGGTPQQVENAAEIAMEHSLGLTCDPISGLVQVPCIERNAISAGKAINAARMSLRGDGTHRVSLDEVITTMKETGADMSDRYKETAGGGLALHVAVNVPEC
ncbi:L-serine ammonia-lyase [uncultured Corynebacterium sp.]|uniref:L-serine ammonia-lyase n=1 Tax=uncultured Corynebacterium sp. TaxID=159447 RepID=UPI0025DA03CE|nr:L-serine ammonia-lyase [uncultured Corynebacterium sp.]